MAFLFLLSGLSAGAFENVRNCAEVSIFVSNSMTDFVHLDVRDDCMAKSVFEKEAEYKGFLQGTKLLLEIAVRAITGTTKGYHIVKGPSTQHGSPKPFQPWQTKNIWFQNQRLDVCFSSVPSDETIVALFDYYGCPHGLLKYYPNEEPINMGCRFCGKNFRSKRTSLALTIAHTHVCAKSRALSMDTSFLPWPEKCTYMISRQTVNSSGNCCNKQLLWTSKKEREASILHIGTHRRYHGIMCRWDGCARMEEGTITNDIVLASKELLDMHIESVHKYTVRERNVLYCFLCDCWMPQGPKSEMHVWAHVSEIECYLQQSGFRGFSSPYSYNRILKPWFCPFCYNNTKLLPSGRFQQHGLLTNYIAHIRSHIGSLSDSQTHKCPVHLAKLCEDESLMTPSEISSHLKVAHRLMR